MSLSPKDILDEEFVEKKSISKFYFWDVIAATIFSVTIYIAIVIFITILNSANVMSFNFYTWIALAIIQMIIGLGTLNESTYKGNIKFNIKGGIVFVLYSSVFYAFVLFNYLINFTGINSTFFFKKEIVTEWEWIILIKFIAIIPITLLFNLFYKYKNDI